MLTVAIILLGSGVTLIWAAATGRDIRQVVGSVIRGEQIPAGQTQAELEQEGQAGQVEASNTLGGTFGPGGVNVPGAREI